MLNKKVLLVLFSIAALGSTASAGALKPDSSNPRFTLWQLPSQGSTQMQSYVIQSAGGKVVVIDGGMTADGAYLRTFLKERGGRVDAWFITHPHQDHINALSWILIHPADLQIDRIYASLPTVEWVEQYAAGSTNTLNGFHAALKGAGRGYTELHQGDVFDLDEIHIEVLSVKDPSLTLNALNNSSVVMHVSDPVKSVLFTGDIGVRAGNKILATIDPRKLKADYVQMAHHGQDCAGKNFYEAVAPDYCLWPTPLWLWDNNNGGGYDSGSWSTLETRKWMEELNVKSNYVSGVSGLIEVR